MQTRESALEIGRELERVLEALRVEHEAMRGVCAARRVAISKADVRALGVCTARENEVVQRIAGMEGRREELVRRAVGLFGRPSDGGQARLSWIASQLEEPLRGRLERSALTLRSTIEGLRVEHAASAQATETIAGHLLGIVRAVEHRLSDSGAYTRTGGARVGPAALSAVDVVS